MICNSGSRHTKSFLLSLSYGKTFEASTGVGVAYELLLHFLLSARAVPTIRLADRRAIANFILTDSASIIID